MLKIQPENLLLLVISTPYLNQPLMIYFHDMMPIFPLKICIVR